MTERYAKLEASEKAKAGEETFGKMFMKGDGT